MGEGTGRIRAHTATNYDRLVAVETSCELEVLSVLGLCSERLLIRSLRFGKQISIALAVSLWGHRFP